MTRCEVFTRESAWSSKPPETVAHNSVFASLPDCLEAKGGNDETVRRLPRFNIYGNVDDDLEHGGIAQLVER